MKQLITIIILIISITASAQKADTIIVSGAYAQIIEEQKQLAEQWQEKELKRMYFIEGLLNGSKKTVTESDTLYFVAPNKIVITKKKKPKS